MDKVHVNILIILMALSICTGGCNNNGNEPDHPQEDTVLPLNIRFDTLTIEEVQQTIQGRWKIVLQGYDGIYNPTDDEYVEFKGADTIRFLKADTTVSTYEIVEWEEEFPSRYKYFCTNQIYPHIDAYSYILTYYYLPAIVNDSMFMSAWPDGTADADKLYYLVRDKNK